MYFKDEAVIPVSKNQNSGKAGANVVCKIVIGRENKFKAVSIHCLGLFECYDFREDNKRGMDSEKKLF